MAANTKPIFPGTVRSVVTEISSTDALNSANVVIATGDSATTTFSGNLGQTHIKLDSVTVTYTIGATTYTATSDSNGNITGENITSASVTADGNISIEFSTAPDNATDITVSFEYYVPISIFVAGENGSRVDSIWIYNNTDSELKAELYQENVLLSPITVGAKSGSQILLNELYDIIDRCKSKYLAPNQSLKLWFNTSSVSETDKIYVVIDGGDY